MSSKTLIFLAVLFGTAILTTIVDRLSGFKNGGSKGSLLLHNLCQQLTGIALGMSLAYAGFWHGF